MVSSVSAPNIMVNRLTTFVMATRPTFWLKPMVVTTQAETMGLTKRRQYFAVRPRSPSMQAAHDHRADHQAEGDGFADRNSAVELVDVVDGRRRAGSLVFHLE